MPRKAYDRGQVVAAAMDLFWTRGYRSTSVSDLCKATRLNPKSLYAEFGDKDALFVEAVTLYTQAALLQTRAALQSTPLGVHNIRRYFEGMAFGPDCRGCLMTMTVNEGPIAPAMATQQVRETLSEIQSMFEANLRASGCGKGEATRLASFLLFNIQGVTTMGKLGATEEALRAVIVTILSALPEPRPSS